MTFRYFIEHPAGAIEAVSLERWASWFETCTTRRVGFTQVTEKYLVVTEFMGMTFIREERPPLFQTTLFGDGGRYSRDDWFYDNRATALFQHESIVRRLQSAGTKIDDAVKNRFANLFTY